MAGRDPLRQGFITLFRVFLRGIFAVAILALLLGLSVGVIRILLELRGVVLGQDINQGLKELVTSFLTLVVVLELIRAFVEYFETERIRLDILLEVGIAFVLREFLLGLFAERIGDMGMVFWSLGLLLLVGAWGLVQLLTARGLKGPA